jgi:hypothetical protein
MYDSYVHFVLFYFILCVCLLSKCTYESMSVLFRLFQFFTLSLEMCVQKYVHKPPLETHVLSYFYFIFYWYPLETNIIVFLY